MIGYILANRLMSSNWDEYSFTAPGARITASFMFALAITSCITISFALVVFFTTPALYKAHQNYLFLSLLLVCLSLVVTMAVTQGHSVMTNGWIFLSGPECSMTGFVTLAACGLEAYNLMCLAIERYFAIVKGKPLSKKQILIMLAIGWIGQPFLVSFPFWIPYFKFVLSPSRLYCSYDYWSRDQLGGALPSTVSSISYVLILNHCYTSIYFYFKKMQKNAKENAVSTIESGNEGQKIRTKNQDEFRILITTFTLTGWTLIAWMPLIANLLYGIITGTRVSAEFDMISAFLLAFGIAGDAVILLMMDRRWNSAAKDLIKKIKV